MKKRFFRISVIIMSMLIITCTFGAWEGKEGNTKSLENTKGKSLTKYFDTEPNINSTGANGAVASIGYNSSSDVNIITGNGNDGALQYAVIPESAAGDGITDDTAAIKKAIDKAIKKGLDVYFPKGTYVISDELKIENFTGTIYGKNATIVSTNDSAAIIKVINSKNVVIKGLTLKHKNETRLDFWKYNSCAAIGVENSENITITENDVSLCCDGIAITECRLVSIIKNKSHDVAQEPIVIRNSQLVDCNFNDCYHHGGDGILIKQTSVYDEAVFNIKFNYIHDAELNNKGDRYGGGLTSNAESGGKLTANKLYYEGNILDGLHYGIQVYNVKNVYISNNVITNMLGTGSFGIWLGTGLNLNTEHTVLENIIISENIVDTTAYGGIKVAIGKLSYECATIRGNIVRNVKGDYGIYAQKCTVLGNKVKDCYRLGRFIDSKVQNNDFDTSHIDGLVSDPKKNCSILLSNSLDFSGNTVKDSFGNVWVATEADESNPKVTGLINGNIIYVPNNEYSILFGSPVVLPVIITDNLCSGTINVTIQDPTPQDPVPSEDNIFTEFLQDNSAPQIVRELEKTETSDGLIIEKVVFRSRVVDGINSDVYAVIVRPKAEGKYPGILINHGGGSKANESACKKYAKRGYIAVSCDLPGICTNKVEYSEGPWKSNNLIFDNGGKLITGGDPEKCVAFDAIIAGIQAFNLLTSQDDVIEDRIGIRGESWGGYMTTMLSGLLGDRVYASYSTYGCGFYDKGTFMTEALNNIPKEDKESWLKYLDAGQKAASIKSRYFIEAAANDTYFWPSAVMATLDKINSVKNQVFSPNTDHFSYIDNSYYFMDYYLKGIGNPMPVLNISKTTMEADGSYTVDFKADTAEKLGEVKLMYSVPDVGWKYRKWFSIPASETSENIYKVVIPHDIYSKQVDWYVIATDARGVRASSLIYDYKYEIAKLVENTAPAIPESDGKKYLTGSEENPVIFTKKDDEGYLIEIIGSDKHYNKAYSEPDIIDGVECRNISGIQRRMYFIIGDEYTHTNKASFTIKVSYFDIGTDELGIKYSSITNLYEEKKIRKTGTNTWQTAEFKIDDAVFEHKQESDSDFFIFTVEEDGYESISKVEIIAN